MGGNEMVEGERREMGAVGRAVHGRRAQSGERVLERGMNVQTPLRRGPSFPSSVDTISIGAKATI